MAERINGGIERYEFYIKVYRRKGELGGRYADIGRRRIHI